MNHVKMILITGRTIEQGKGLESGKTSQEYFEEVAVAFLNESDMKELELEENASVKISTNYGSIVVKCKEGRLDRGILFMPLGPWTGALIGSDTEGTGMPKTRCIEVEVSKIEEKPTSLDEVLGRLRI